MRGLNHEKKDLVDAESALVEKFAIIPKTGFLILFAV
jgi:hypothetical protein